jgi:putative flippase GtrA
MLVRFVLYTGAGAVGTCGHYLVLIGLVEGTGLTAPVGAAAGAATGAVINYVLNYKLTFRSTHSHAVTMPRFALVAMAGLWLSWGTVFLGERLGLHYVLSQVIATLLTLLFGFLVSYLWVFPASTANDPSQRR